MGIGEILETWWGLIPVAYIIYQVIRDAVKEAKNSGSVDAEQNIAINTINGRIDTMKKDIENIRERVNGMDGKATKEIQNLEAKMEAKFNQLTELILKLMRNDKI